MRKFLTLVTVLLTVQFSNAAQVDYGLTFGTFLNQGSLVISGGRFELGTFTGYTDVSGTAFFTGKDYATLRSSYVLYGDSVTTTDTSGQFCDNETSCFRTG